MAKRVSPRKKWSAGVRRESHALTLDKGLFSQRYQPRRRRRLPAGRRKTLEAAKGELRRLFGKQRA